MGEKTALELLEEIADQLKLERPSSVTGTDPQTRQLLRFLNKTGRELAKRRIWEELTLEHVVEIGEPTTLSVTSVAGDKTLIVSSTAALSALGAEYWAVTGNGVQIATRIESITDATTLELTQSVDVSQSGEDFTFTQDTFDLPADYYSSIQQTEWDRRFQWRLIGPDSPQTDQWHRSGIVTVGPRRRFRRVGRPAKMRIWPPPSAATDAPGTLAYEYRTKAWMQTAMGVLGTAFTANDDEHAFPDDDLLIDGVKWRYWQINGLPYKAFQKEYYENLDIVKGASSGGPVLSTTRRSPGYLISPANIQDGNFPGPEE